MQRISPNWTLNAGMRVMFLRPTGLRPLRFFSSSHMPVTIVPNTSANNPVALERLRFIVNLTDPVFRGVYHGKRKHEDDFEEMKRRSRDAGIKSLIITGTSLRESRHAVELAKEHGFYATVGCHPTRTTDFEKHKSGPEGYLKSLEDLISANLTGPGRVVAIGELGLDYDRTHHAPINIQKEYFRMQLSLVKKYHLPMFLHSRAAHADFVQILTEEGFGNNGGRNVGGAGGVVHSFTGTVEEAQDYMNMGFHIGLNGCSLKTPGNLQAALSILPQWIMFETDAPWCSLTSTHASKPHLDELPSKYRSVFFPSGTKPDRFVMGKPVKSRNEPITIGGIAWVVYCLHQKAREEGLAKGEQMIDMPYWKIVQKAYKNTIELFQLPELVDA
ncbi:hypothetical protein P691DRAFT_853750 [Macrolepiota fuliginosa MF-IS2]|uniref:Mg-dependent DNase n=1 Tax=Macrolepiota fuliginosa MF-IS2 TaxID=1400762 RepID=A0A9P5XN40_9AGAR|nr:hypothetical protein P691DRAFT_853750 [Macrolepiota fuliginosa MF-IS2]